MENGNHGDSQVSPGVMMSWMVAASRRHTVKPVLSGHSKRRLKLVFKTDYRLMPVKSIAECSKGSILQYFRPSLSYSLTLRPLFRLFLSGHLRQVLLYIFFKVKLHLMSWMVAACRRLYVL